MKEATPPILLVILAVVIGVIVYLYSGYTAATEPQPQIQAVPTPVTTQVPFTELAYGLHSTVSVPTNYVIHSSTQLAQLWKIADAQGTPPMIDFSTDTVLAIFAGQEPTLGYSIAVSKIEDGSERIVTVTLTKPYTGCIVGQIVTSPYEIIKVAKTSLPLAHQDVATSTSCVK